MKCFPSPSIRDRCKGRGWAASGMPMREGMEESVGRWARGNTGRKKGRNKDGKEADGPVDAENLQREKRRKGWQECERARREDGR